MRAIILAAGRGLRLQQPEDQQLPKCLLRFGGMTLLERHLHLLRNAGIEEIVLALGFRHELVEKELDRLRWKPRPEIVLNSRFDLGSVLTVHTAADAMTRGGDVLLMDADVLYDERILSALVAGRQPVNRMLIDREFEAGEEPVKLCVRAGVPIELRKKLAADLRLYRARPRRDAARGSGAGSDPGGQPALRGYRRHGSAVDRNRLCR
jgi:choline kinase